MKKVLTVASLCLLAGCASFKPTYDVVEASEDSAPKWIRQEKAAKIDSSSEAKEYRYFVDEAENVNKRLCLKSAETRATQKVAGEIAQELVSKYAEMTKSEDEQALAKMKEELKQNIQVNLHGVTVAGKYYEKRAYKVEKGAPKNYETYKCDANVKMKKTDLAAAIEAYKAKTLADLKNSDKKAMEAAADSLLANLKAVEE